ncbi:hypothetical protein CYLTODRAFT_241785 [Cylindrobasidium torrendii FP15055 ss-10]|uniref:Telomerase reverse transcriptase n=1 Tax=Cylindrobasidium torrendii FP15055 ss-10 TaxID=1314674 RepID=A0A0D7BEW9_9AGAR|nr:hypothetical protein CYLTODRAFT_241785 [Cylindrobasidium torrendii FP15055 ss-10]
MLRKRRDTNASPLHACYDSVKTLEAYFGVNATAPRTSEGRERTQYDVFLGTTYVCNVKDCENRAAALASLPKMRNMREVVQHAQALLIGRREKDNVLTVGCATNKAKKVHPSSVVRAFQSEEWSILFSSVGADRLLDTLTNASIFMTLPNDCLLQLTGKSIPRPSPPARDKPHKYTSKKRLADKLDTEPTAKRPKHTNLKRTESGNPAQVCSVSKSPNEIIFARQRLFYGRPTTLPNNTNLTLCGLYPRHILNQLMPAYPLGSDLKDDENEPQGKTEQERVEQENALHKAQQDKARCLSKYVFPRQYGLRSAFAFEAEGWGGALLPNFEDRNDEIQRMPKSVKTPKRVKPALVLLERLIWRHGKCKYALLRDATCPTKRKPGHSRDNDAVLELFASSISQIKSQVSLSLDSEGVSLIAPEPSPNNKPHILDYACSHTEVFRYVRAVIKAVIPNEFWGGEQNFKLVCDSVKEFVSARRFESISLHNVLQGFNTTGCGWLAPSKEQTRVAASDMYKRRELLEDFMYWFFDSFVMYVLKTAFYITESAPLRNRVLYFLHDDWRWLCAPLIQRLTSETFHKLTTEEARDIVRRRSLGISFVRLLPKESGVRPIVNLRRKKGKNDFSINQILRAAFEILTFERKNHPELLGTSILGRNDTYTKLKSFKKTMLDLHNQELPKLYFVKVDVQACFDNIDQTKLLEILQQVIRHSHYNMEKYLKVAQPAGHNISHKWLRRAFVDASGLHGVRQRACGIVAWRRVCRPGCHTIPRKETQNSGITQRTY